MSSQREQMIRQRIDTALKPESLELIDDSHLHAGHGATGGHYTVRIVSESFIGKNLIQRHRLVYDAVGDLMSSEIHALSIQAYTPDEKKSSQHP